MILFQPNLNSRLIINKNETKEISFYCYCKDAHEIEVWTNISPNLIWHSLPFKRQKPNVLHLSIPTQPLELDQPYEFTFRKRKPDGDWEWLGQPGQNGSIHLTSTTQHSPPFHRFKTKERTTTIQLSVHSYTAILRKGHCWLTPISGDRWVEDINERWQMLLYKDKRGADHVWLSREEGFWISPGRDQTIVLHGKGEWISCGSLREIVRCQEQPEDGPDWIDRLGYCSWNSLGYDLNEERLRKIVGELRSIGYVVLDDGWQSNRSGRLKGFEADEGKFPKGLKECLNEIRLNSSVKKIGIWHTLWGDWYGIDRDFSDKMGYSWKSVSSSKGEIGLVNDPERFYKDFYGYLKESGVDFVKVDNQGGFQDLDLSEEDRNKIWDDYRSAMIKASDKFFDGCVIHCMALTPHVLFKPIFSNNKKAIFRNSDDFFPDEPDSHTWHIFANTINSLITSCLPVIPDWDMFQSKHPYAEYHAVSRAISGGPVYITDKIGQHDHQLIKRLTAETKHSGLTLLRSAQPSQPYLGLSMTNHHQEENGLTYHVYGFFHHTQPELIQIPNPPDTIRYVVLGPNQGEINPDVIRLGQVSLVSISPLRRSGKVSIAALGLLDKLNGTRAIIKTKLDEHYTCWLSHQSEVCGFWVYPCPDEVRLDSVKAIWNYKDGLLTINMLPTKKSRHKDYLVEMFFFFFCKKLK